MPAGTFNPRARRVDEVAGGVDRHASISEVFAVMDEDKSGSVDLAEFIGIFSKVGERNAQRDMELIDAKGGEKHTSEVTKYGGFSREQKNVEETDGLLQQDEFIFHMMELMEVKTDVEFLAEIKMFLKRLAEGGRSLQLRKVFAKMDVDGSGFVDLVELKSIVGKTTDDGQASLPPPCPVPS